MLAPEQPNSLLISLRLRIGGTVEIEVNSPLLLHWMEGQRRSFVLLNVVTVSE